VLAQVALATDVTGTLPIANGGTNSTSTPTAGGAVYGTSTAYAITAAGTAGQVLTSAGASAPTWSNLPTNVASITFGTTGLTPSTATTGAVSVGGTLAIANGGTGQTTAAGAITSLGATTVGGNMFTLTNPSAVTFPRFNADNTVSALNAADFRTAIGAGTGGGTVTSVTGTSPVASSGGATPAISLDAGYGDTLNPYASKTAKFFLAAPTAADGIPGFRAIAAADIPTLNQNTTGTAAGLSATLAVASGGTGKTSYTANGVLYASGAGTLANGTGLTFDGTKLGLGVPAPFYTLDVAMASGTFIGSFKNSSTASNQANIVLWSQGESGSAVGYVGTGGSTFSGAFSNKFVVGTQGAHDLGLVTNGSLRALIDSTGTFRVVGAGTAGSTDAVQFNVAAPANAMVLNASGNLGLGVSPSAWGTGYKALDVNTFGSINSTGSNMRVTSNAFFNGTQWIRKIEAEAARYDQTAGEHKWFIGAYGAAGASIAFTQVMTLKQTGATTYLGIGETSPTTALFVAGPDNTVATFRNTDGSTAHIAFYNDNGTGSNDVLCGSENSTFVIYTNTIKRVTVDDLGSLKMITGPVMPYAPAPDVLTTNGTLTAANIMTQILNTTGSMTSVSMPTGAALESSNLWVENNIGYDFYVINTASGTVTFSANTGVTTLGSLAVATGTSAQFRIRRTAASTYVLYRLS
jgi:hypothetical protein